MIGLRLTHPCGMCDDRPAVRELILEVPAGRIYVRVCDLCGRGTDRDVIKRFVLKFPHPQVVPS